MKITGEYRALKFKRFEILENEEKIDIDMRKNKI